MWLAITGVIWLVAAVLCIRHVLKQIKPYDEQKHADSRYERDFEDIYNTAFDVDEELDPIGEENEDPKF